MTLRKFHEDITEMLKEHPEWSDLPCIYSIDEEGIDYVKVTTPPTFAKVKNLNIGFLTVQGYFDGSEDCEVKEEDVNCVLIN